jgi:collagenase-like PrtC family protease
MAAITTNISAVFNSLKTKFELLEDKEYLLRPLAIEVLPLIKERIHIEGKASDGSQIGTYANSYMAQRERAGRGESRKVIVALTSQLEQDWSVQPTNRGYGIGFNNVLNVQKMKWVEEQKGKIIANLSADEKKYISERLQELVNGAFG